MELRDLMWKTKDGKRIKIKDLETAHLENIPGHIKKRWGAYISQYGEARLKQYLQAINQEIRLRKINRLNNNPDNSELF